MSAENKTDEPASLPGPEEHDYEARMTFTEHLGELRDRIIRSGIALIVTFFVSYAFSDFFFEVIAGALSPENLKEAFGEEAKPPQWYSGQPLEGFMTKVRLACYGAILLSFPYVVWQLCAFIFPGLHKNERRAVQFLILGCGLLGLVGFTVAYVFVLPTVLPYLLAWAPEGVVPMLRLGETISMIFKALVGFSIAFQFPMAVIVLVYMGILTPQVLKDYRKMAVIGMAVLSAMFTPPEPVSMMAMLVPLYLLYEVSIIASYVVVRRKALSEKRDLEGPTDQ